MAVDRLKQRENTDGSRLFRRSSARIYRPSFRENEPKTVSINLGTDYISRLLERHRSQHLFANVSIPDPNCLIS